MRTNRKGVTKRWRGLEKLERDAGVKLVRKKKKKKRKLQWPGGWEGIKQAQKLKQKKRRKQAVREERRREQFFLVPNVFFWVRQWFVRGETVPPSQTRLVSDLNRERTESEQITEDYSIAQTLRWLSFCLFSTRLLLHFPTTPFRDVSTRSTAFTVDAAKHNTAITVFVLAALCIFNLLLFFSPSASQTVWSMTWFRISQSSHRWQINQSALCSYDYRWRHHTYTPSNRNWQNAWVNAWVYK